VYQTAPNSPIEKLAGAGHNRFAGELYAVAEDI